jgi:hypothetical protein
MLVLARTRSGLLPAVFRIRVSICTFVLVKQVNRYVYLVAANSNAARHSSAKLPSSLSRSSHSRGVAAPASPASLAAEFFF